MKKSTLIPCPSLRAFCDAVAENLSLGKQEPTSGSLHHLKKGIGLTTNKQNKASWQAKVEALGVNWHYSWEASLPEEEPQGVEFVPMIWGYWGPSEKFLRRMEELSATKSAHSRKPLLGFNEPDNKRQAHMSVQRALEGWPYLMKTGLRLGSPAAVHPHEEWMREFMKQAKEKNYRVDFVCVHWYRSPNTGEFVNYLRKIHKMYGKPVWITEFAVADWKAKSRQQNRYSPEIVLRFMREILPRLEELDFVERYAWFSLGEDDRTLGPSALFKEDGSLTALGRFYASHEYATSQANEAGARQTKPSGRNSGDTILISLTALGSNRFHRWHESPGL